MPLTGCNFHDLLKICYTFVFIHPYPYYFSYTRLLTNCLRTAGGVAAVLTGCLGTAVLLAFFEPKLRGNVWDLLITARFPGRFELTVNLRPDATK